MNRSLARPPQLIRPHRHTALAMVACCSLITAYAIGAAAPALAAPSTSAPQATSPAPATASAPASAPRVAPTPATQTVAAASAGKAFSCSTPTIFLAQQSPTKLYTSQYGAGKTTFSALGKAHGWSYNAVGYNPKDKYLYAVSINGGKKYPAGHLLKIGASGAIDDLGAVKGDSYLTKNGAVTGAFDSSHHFWVTSPGAPAIDEIAVGSHPKVSKKLKVSPAKSWKSLDYTYDGGFMWGMESAGSTVMIQRLSLSNGKVSNFTAPSSIGAGAKFGAAWTYGNGNLGFDNNTTGGLFQIEVSAPSSTAPTFTVISSYSGPVAGSNDDGAACVPTPADLSISNQAPASAVVGSEIDWIVKVTNNGKGVSSGYTITDPLPSGVTNAGSSSAGCSATGSTVKCAEGTLTVGKSMTFTISGNAPVTAGTCVTNTVSVLGNELDKVASNNSADAQTCTTSAAPTLGSETPTPTTDVQGADFQDQVTLAGGVNPTGTITFAIYGPSQSSCTGTPQQTVSATVSGNGVYTSPDATVSDVGAHYWLASYGGDSNNASATTTCSAGLFTVSSAGPGTCTIHWVGSSSGGSWSTASNWSPSRLPTTGDVVCIGTSTTSISGSVTFDGGSGSYNTSIAQIKDYGGLSITNGNLLITDTSSASAEQSFVTNFSISGGQLGDSTTSTAGLAVSGTLTETGGSFVAPTSQSTQPVLTQSGSGSVFMQNGTLNHWSLMLSGPMSFGSGYTYVQNGGAITASGAVTVTTSPTLYDYGSAGTFTLTSSGSLTMNSSGSTFTLGMPFALSGPVTVTAGTLNLGNSDGGSLADFTVASGATLQLSPTTSKTDTITSGSTNSGAGVLKTTGNGTITVNAPLNVDNVLVNGSTLNPTDGQTSNGGLTVSSGEYEATGAHTYTVGGFTMTAGQVGDSTTNQTGVTDSGDFSFTGGSFIAPTSQATQPVLNQTGTGNAYIAGGTLNHWTLTLAASLSIGNGYTYVQNGGAITPGSNITIASGATLYDYGSAGTFTIASGKTLTETGTSSAPNLNVPVTNNGTITASGPGLTFKNLTNNGTLDLGTSTVTVQTAYAPASGSSLNVTIGGTTAGTSYGDLVVSAAMTIAGTLNITTPGTFTPTSGTQFTIATFTSESGSFGSVHTTGASSYNAPTISSTKIVLQAS